MINEVLTHLASRGIHEHANLVRRTVIDKSSDPNAPKIVVPIWSIVMMVLTAIVFTVFIQAIEYTLRFVVAPLAMIETPAAAVTVNPTTGLPVDKEEAERLLDSPAAEIEIVPVKPITSKIRTTIKHITSQAGFWARWRGIVPAVVYSFTNLFWTHALARLLPAVYGREMIASIFVAMATANIHMAYVHAVISQPTSQKWYQRLGDLKSLRALVLPQVVRVAAAYAVIYLTGAAIAIGGVGNAAILASDAKRKAGFISIPLTLLAVTVLCSLLLVFVYLPAQVACVRVEASMLPDEHETIVPFDRSFGGVVVPAILGGSGALTLRDAWKSFDREARRRVLRLYAKIFLVLSALFFMMVGVLGVEFWIVAGDQIRKAIRENNGRMPGMVNAM